MPLVDNLLLLGGGNVTTHVNLLYAWGDSSWGQVDNNITLLAPGNVGSSSWTAVSAGYNHALAIRSDGALFAWGVNTSGQLGQNNLTSPLTSPVQIGTSSWTAIAAGNANSLAIRSDSTLWGWGVNNIGQLGNLSVTNQSSPVQISIGSSFTAVTTDGASSGALRTDGALIVWGNPYLGDNSVISKSSPVQIGTSSWTAIGFGIAHCGIKTDGSLWSWGTAGRVGDGTNVVRSSPVQIGGTLNGTSWSVIAVGGQSSAAIKNDGTLWTWGYDQGQGSIGDGLGLDRSSPVQVGSSSWTTCAAGGQQGSNRVLAIRSDGALFAWGNNSSGALGDGTVTGRSSPVQIGTSSWIAVAVNSHSLAIRSDGALFAWGPNGYGKLGVNDATNRSSPSQVGTSSWTAIFCGPQGSAAIRSGGSLFTWGRSQLGQLGDGTVVDKSSPVQIGTSSWIACGMGMQTASALRSDGGLFTWGWAGAALLGDGTVVNRSSPVQIGTSSWTALAQAKVHSSNAEGYGTFILIRSDSTMWAWGVNQYGHLGDGTNINRARPVIISEGSWATASSGPGQSGAIRSDGALFMWGLSRVGAFPSGSVGDGVLVDRSSPVQIGTIAATATSWTSISSNGQATMHAIRSDGTLFGWGSNGNGQLGDLTATVRSSPVQIGYTLTDQQWSVVSGRQSSVLAIRTDGALFAWGLGNLGQLGNGWVDSVSSPVQIGTSSWIACSPGSRSAAAIRSDGGLFTWGTVGYNGDGTNNDTRSPVQAGTSSWTAIASGPLWTLAIRSDGALFTWGVGVANSGGVLGDGTVIFKSSPVQIGTSSWTAIAAGGIAVSAAIRKDGGLFTWGVGALGNGSVTRSSPVQIGTSSWTAVAVGSYACLGIRSDGALFGWSSAGKNLTGEVGDGTTIARSSPVQIGTSSWIAIAAGLSTQPSSGMSAAIRLDGALFTWGFNNVGQLGDGTLVNKSSPVQIGTSSWIAISSGNDFINAIRSDKKIFSWGSQNLNGTLGDFSTTNRSLPVLITGIRSWNTFTKAFGGIGNHNMVRRSDGMLFTIGRGTEGALGDNTVVNKSSPVMVGIKNGANAVSNWTSWTSLGS